MICRRVSHDLASHPIVSTHLVFILAIFKDTFLMDITYLHFLQPPTLDPCSGLCLCCQWNVWRSVGVSQVAKYRRHRIGAIFQVEPIGISLCAGWDKH